MRYRCIAHHQRGFTLLEVVVAFALLALALTLLLGAMSLASRQVRDSGDASRAVLHAQSLLAQVGVGEVLAPGEREGEFERGRYRWKLRMELYDDPDAIASASGGTAASALLQLKLDVEWGKGASQHLSWETLRLVPAHGVNSQL